VTDLTALTAQVVEEFEDMGEAVSFAGAERITLPLRPTWLRRALRNLISNALRHGGSTARVSLARQPGSVTITVEDEGPGIPAEDLQRMLEPFTRGDPSRNRGTGGAGLGLTLARAIAEQHGGSLTLANRTAPDGSLAGLTASLTLPLT
ncbi:MAG: sensor histidine kinase, partial [Novosphingobium sp.]